jgi:hypothetical protein
MRDRRQSERLPSILEGRIVLDRQAPRTQCTLRDISGTGARVWLPDSIDLPREFQLEIPALDQIMPVQLMWSNGRTHGVIFLEELRSLSDSDEVPASLQPASDLQGIPKGLSPLTEGVLEEARQQLAEILELPAVKIKLKIEIDP